MGGRRVDRADADELADAFMVVVERYDIDYNQQANADAFEDWIATQALTYIRTWRRLQASDEINELVASFGRSG